MSSTYSLDEAAEVLGCSRWTLRDWVTRGEVPHRRVGRVKGVYFTDEDLAAIRAARARPVTARTPGGHGRRPADTVPMTEVPAEFAVLRRGRRS